MQAVSRSQGVRPPAVAGRFYPGDPEELQATVAMLLGRVGEASAGAPKALIAPHAGYVYSGDVAAAAFVTLRRVAPTIARVVLVGPAHYVPFAGIAASATDAFATPLGRVPVDHDAVGAIADLPFVRRSDAPHAPEHACGSRSPTPATRRDRATASWATAPGCSRRVGPARRRNSATRLAGATADRSARSAGRRNPVGRGRRRALRSPLRFRRVQPVLTFGRCRVRQQCAVRRSRVIATAQMSASRAAPGSKGSARRLGDAGDDARAAVSRERLARCAMVNDGRMTAAGMGRRRHPRWRWIAGVGIGVALGAAATRAQSPGNAHASPTAATAMAQKFDMRRSRLQQAQHTEDDLYRTNVRSCEQPHVSPACRAQADARHREAVQEIQKAMEDLVADEHRELRAIDESQDGASQPHRTAAGDRRAPVAEQGRRGRLAAGPH